VALAAGSGSSLSSLALLCGCTLDCVDCGLGGRAARRESFELLYVKGTPRGLGGATWRAQRALGQAALALGGAARDLPLALALAPRRPRPMSHARFSTCAVFYLSILSANGYRDQHVVASPSAIG
jgi:hypothetical protein